VRQRRTTSTTNKRSWFLVVWLNLATIGRRVAAQVGLEAETGRALFPEGGSSEQLSQNSSTPTSVEHCSQSTENGGF
jgi:hypothetical protein